MIFFFLYFVSSEEYGVWHIILLLPRLYLHATSKAFLCSQRNGVDHLLLLLLRLFLLATPKVFCVLRRIWCVAYNPFAAEVIFACYIEGLFFRRVHMPGFQSLFSFCATKLIFLCTFSEKMCRKKYMIFSSCHVCAFVYSRNGIPTKGALFSWEVFLEMSLLPRGQYCLISARLQLFYA